MQEKLAFTSGDDEFYAYKSCSVPVVLGASDFDIILFMKEIILCLVFISSGMLFAAKKIVVEQLPEANRHLAEVETNVESKISSTGFSLFVR